MENRPQDGCLRPCLPQITCRARPDPQYLHAQHRFNPASSLPTPLRYHRLSVEAWFVKTCVKISCPLRSSNFEISKGKQCTSGYWWRACSAVSGYNDMAIMYIGSRGMIETYWERCHSAPPSFAGGSTVTPWAWANALTAGE